MQHPLEFFQEKHIFSQKLSPAGALLNFVVDVNIKHQK